MIESRLWSPQRYTVNVLTVEDSFHLLSNLPKFVSLCFRPFVLETFIIIAHPLLLLSL